MQKKLSYTTQEHIETHVLANIDSINRSLSEWSIMCMSALSRKEADKHHLPIITLRTIMELLPLIGLDPERPWTSLESIRRQIRKEVMEESERDIRSLKIKFEDREAMLLTKIKDLESGKLQIQNQLDQTERNRQELLLKVTGTSKRSFF